MLGHRHSVKQVSGAIGRDGKTTTYASGRKQFGSISVHVTVGTDKVILSFQHAPERRTHEKPAHDSERCEDLPHHDKRTPDIGWSTFRSIDWYGRAFRPNAQTEQEPEGNHALPAPCKGLTEAEGGGEYTGKEDGASAA